MSRSLANQAIEKSVPGMPASLFQVLSRSAERGALTPELNSVPRCELGHEPFIAIRFLAAQLMIQVRDSGDREPGLRSKLQQHMQQTHRVAAAGHRHCDAVAGSEHVITGNRLEYL